MRRFIFASHHKLAYGLKDTVDFLTGATKIIYDIKQKILIQSLLNYLLHLMMKMKLLF